MSNYNHSLKERFVIKKRNIIEKVKMFVFDTLASAGKFVDDYGVEPVAIALNFPMDQIRLLLVWLSMLPIGWFLHFCVRGAKLRHAVNLTVGMLGMIYFFGFAVVHVFTMSGVSYLIMLLAPRELQ